MFLGQFGFFLGKLRLGWPEKISVSWFTAAEGANNSNSSHRRVFNEHNWCSTATKWGIFYSSSKSFSNYLLKRLNYFVLRRFFEWANAFHSILAFGWCRKCSLRGSSRPLLRQPTHARAHPRQGFVTRGSVLYIKI